MTVLFSLFIYDFSNQPRLQNQFSVKWLNTVVLQVGMTFVFTLRNTTYQSRWLTLLCRSRPKSQISFLSKTTHCRSGVEQQWNGLASISNYEQRFIEQDKYRSFQYGNLDDAELVLNASITTRNHARRGVWSIFKHPIKN